MKVSLTSLKLCEAMSWSEVQAHGLHDTWTYFWPCWNSLYFPRQSTWHIMYLLNCYWNDESTHSLHTSNIQMISTLEESFWEREREREKKRESIFQCLLIPIANFSVGMKASENLDLKIFFLLRARSPCFFSLA